MRLILIVILIFFSVYLRAQNNELLVRANQLFSFNATEDVFPDDTTVTIVPSEKDDFTQIALDISYFRKIKRMKWLVRIGFDRVTSDGNLLTSRSMGYASSFEDRDRYTLRIGTGIYYPARLENEKLSLSFTCVSMLDYRYFHRDNFKADFFNDQDGYEGGYERNLEYPDSWRLRLETGLAFYYFFFGNFGFGGELATYLYYDRLKGSTSDSFIFFDENRGIAESRFTERKEKRGLLGLSTTFAMGISYKF